MGLYILCSAIGVGVDLFRIIRKTSRFPLDISLSRRTGVRNSIYRRTCKMKTVHKMKSIDNRWMMLIVQRVL